MRRLCEEANEKQRAISLEPVSTHAYTHKSQTLNLPLIGMFLSSHTHKAAYLLDVPKVTKILYFSKRNVLTHSHIHA